MFCSQGIASHAQQVELGLGPALGCDDVEGDTEPGIDASRLAHRLLGLGPGLAGETGQIIDRGSQAGEGLAGARTRVWIFGEHALDLVALVGRKLIERRREVAGEQRSPQRADHVDVAGLARVTAAALLGWRQRQELLEPAGPGRDQTREVMSAKGPDQRAAEGVADDLAWQQRTMDEPCSMGGGEGRRA